jgi:hypothetical protein
MIGFSIDYAPPDNALRFSPELAYAKMKEECEKAVPLDPLLAEHI